MPPLEINATQPWLIAPDGNVAQITRRLAVMNLALRQCHGARAHLFDGETELSLVA